MTLDELLRGDPAPRLAAEGSLRDVLQWAAAQGSLAPSELNSQPWLFHGALSSDGRSGTLDLLLDESRSLPSVDPTGREALLGCGAALLNVRLALRGAAVGTHVSLAPDVTRPDLLARITVGGQSTEAPEDRPLRLAVAERKTHRGAFLPGTVPADVRDRLVAEAAYEGACVDVLDERAQRRLADLNAEAERLLWADGPFRREVASWTGRRRSGSSQDLKAWQAWSEPAQELDAPPTPEARPEPLVVVVSSVSDSRAALLRAGCGLQRLLLVARTLGLSAGFLDAALHVEALRATVTRELGIDHPQVVLRIGYAAGRSSAPGHPGRKALALKDLTRPGTFDPSGS